MAAIDLTYLKKRAALIGDSKDSFRDDKVEIALSKVVPPALTAEDSDEPENDGFDCVVPNKLFRNWIDMIPEKDRGFIRFIYGNGEAADVLKYIRLAMTKPAWRNFQAAVSEPPNDSDLFLMRYLLWCGVVLKKPVGFDFMNYEMNMIFNSLPVDISKNKVEIGRNFSFVDFYRQIKFAEWGIRNAS